MLGRHRLAALPRQLGGARTFASSTSAVEGVHTQTGATAPRVVYSHARTPRPARAVSAGKSLTIWLSRRGAVIGSSTHGDHAASVLPCSPPRAARSIRPAAPWRRRRRHQLDRVPRSSPRRGAPRAPAPRRCRWRGPAREIGPFTPSSAAGSIPTTVRAAYRPPTSGGWGNTARKPALTCQGFEAGSPDR